MSDIDERVPSKSKKRTTSFSDKESVSRSRSRSVSKSYKRKFASRSRSRSRSPRRKRYSRSRSRSQYASTSRRVHRSSRYTRSRSRSHSPRHRDRRGRDDHRRSGGYYKSRSKSPLSSRRRHVASRERPKQSNCVGVFGLSLYTQERDLRDCFSRYGPLEEVQVVYDHQTGRSRGFAFIYFRSTDDAEEAKDRAPGTEIDGRKIRVDYSITERAHTPTPGVYLGKPTGGSYRSSRRSPSPYQQRSSGRRGYSRSRSRSRGERDYNSPRYARIQ